VWVIHCIDNNITFSRFDNLLEHDGVKYYPDFLIGNDIIEIKGYEKQDSVDKKTDVAKFHGYNVVILRKDDLQVQFDWVTSHYNTTKYYTLYDNYKPSYTYNCAHCKTLFTRDKKLKTDIVYCSRKCAGHGHTGTPNPLGHNQYTNNMGD